MAPKKKAFATPRKRFIKLAGMTASVAGQYTRAKVKGVFRSDEAREEDLAEMYREVGWSIVETLGELKGAAMKVGQALSQMQHLLPDEFSEELSKLQSQAVPVPYEAIESQLVSEFGFPPEKLFARFDREPYAAASVGQVHRAATWDGVEVVVKIQYPGVDVSCESDLNHLRRALQLGGLLKVDRNALEEVFDEVHHKLMLELDYRLEAKNLRFFREHYQRAEKIIIPDLVENFCSKRVLTLVYEPGDHLAEMKAPKYSQEMINEIGRRLFNLMGDQLFFLHRIHGDPHPGNFAFREDGSIVMYDFGSVSDLSPELVAAYVRIARAALDGDYLTLDQELIDVGVRNADAAPVEESYYEYWLDIFLRPLQQDHSYQYSLQNLQEEMFKRKDMLLSHWGAFQPCADTLFVNRVITGHFLNLANMGVEHAYLEDLERMLVEARIE